MTVKTTKKRQTKLDWLKHFDPDNEKSRAEGIFGLPCTYDESKLILIPVPWDISSPNGIFVATPEKIFCASKKISLLTEEHEGFWKKGIFGQNIPIKWKETSEEFVKARRKISRHFYFNGIKQTELFQEIRRINLTCRLLNEWIENKTGQVLNDEKICGLIGGDSGYLSGFIHSLSKKFPQFGILTIDAYSGFEKHHYGLEFSQYSNMLGVADNPSVKRIVLFGTRRFNYSSSEEIQSNSKKIRKYSLQILDENKIRGMTWKMLVNDALSALPEHIFLNFNFQSIDFSATPEGSIREPGGLSLAEMKSLLIEIRNNSKKLIGFSLGGVNAAYDREVSSAVYLLYDICQTALVTSEKK